MPKVETFGIPSNSYWCDVIYSVNSQLLLGFNELSFLNLTF